jgi:hypothetical protein
MLHPDHTPRTVAARSRVGAWDVRWIIILFAITWTFASQTAVASDKPKGLYFSGRLIELDAAKHIFTIRSKNKELVFTIHPARCDITVDGSITHRSLRFAHIGDAVMGKLSTKEAKPFVTWVEFTRKTAAGQTRSQGGPATSLARICRNGLSQGITLRK